VIDLALASDRLAETFELAGHPVVEFDHIIEGLGDFAVDPRWPRGRRTEKSPRRKARRAESSSPVSIGSMS